MPGQARPCDSQFCTIRSFTAHIRLVLLLRCRLKLGSSYLSKAAYLLALKCNNNVWEALSWTAVSRWLGWWYLFFLEYFPDHIQGMKVDQQRPDLVSQLHDFNRGQLCPALPSKVWQSLLSEGVSKKVFACDQSFGVQLCCSNIALQSVLVCAGG